jgi:glucosamine 6-phosphate synthetase-like amidotransferase/phosphosugar isomerase protein
VLINLIEEVQKRKFKIRKSSSNCLKSSGRAYAICLIKNPDEIVAARLGSPLALV